MIVQGTEAVQVNWPACEMARIAIGKSARAVFHQEQPQGSQTRKNIPAPSAESRPYPVLGPAIRVILLRTG
jgi:hypothetical protein